MNDPQVIWRLGRWVAERKPGTAYLSAGEVSFAMALSGGRIVSVTGIDTSLLGQALDCEPVGEEDLVDEAMAVAAAHSIPEATAMGAAKVLIQDHLRTWFLAPDRTLELVEALQESRSENSISATHALVELVLSDPEGETTTAVLPGLNVLLRRAEGFLDLYAPLGLSEEADLIVAKITGQRTAEEIASRSPHDRVDVIRLLAALTASGMLEAVRAASPEDTPILVADPEPQAGIHHGSSAKRLSPLLILAVAAVIVISAIATWWWFAFRQEAAQAPSEITGHWAIAVDLGCEPHEFRRLLQVARRHEEVRPHAVTEIDETGDDTCWQLVWGDFSTQSEAQASIGDVPDAILRDGFEPHVVEVGDETDVVEEGG